MKKFVLKLDLEGDDKEKQRRALKTVAALSGIDEITIDTKGKKLTVIGTVDPITVVSKLRKKYWQADIVSVGPAKEEKKEEPKKEEPKKDEPSKEEPKKDEAQKQDPKKEEEEEKKKDGEKKASETDQLPVLGTAMQMQMQYRPYYPPMNTYYYVNHSVEENPNACTIC